MEHLVDLPSRRKKPPAHLELRALAKALAEKLEGEVRFDQGARALYATDGSNYRQAPIGVVIPRTIEDVERTVELCREFGAPIFSRGGGTSLAGQCCNAAVAIDMGKYLRKIDRLDHQRRRARVEPGVVCDQLRDAAHERGLTYGPDPATHRWCTFGGMLGNNSCGTHSQEAGRTSDNVESLDVLTYGGLRFTAGALSEEELERRIQRGGELGRIYGRLRALRDRYADEIRRRYTPLPRRISGYALDALLPENGFHVGRALVGTESTCVTVLGATVHLIPHPPYRSLVLLGFPDVFTAADAVVEVAKTGPIGLEGLDRKFIDGLRKKHLTEEETHLYMDAGGYLLAEFGGHTQAEADAAGKALINAMAKTASDARAFSDPAEQKKVWEVREHGLGATAHVPGERENWEGWEDSAVPPDQLGKYLREFQRLLDHYQYHGSLYGHFGQGCLHTRLDFDLKSSAGIQQFRAFLDDAADLVVEHHGSFSGEHGDGQSRAELLPKLYGHELVRAFEEFKDIWDPQRKMNPGKIVRPYRITENLRYGPDYQAAEVETTLHFPEDRDSFARAAERCVGVGKCRNTGGEVMCPSYQVTLEEKHSTRGRARLLWEMLNGELAGEGFASEEVKEALDLCLACKGCKTECPVNVDMAAYKSEFLAHYYRHPGKHRPRSAYAFGWIHRWARLAGLAPVLANFFTQVPGLRRLAKWIAGVAPDRRMPAFAPINFREWFEERRRNKPEPRDDVPRLLLWADTFNNYFHPETLRAAVEVLEDAGFEVALPQRRLCCGRPLYDFGMLDLAKKQLAEILDALREDVRARVPVVVLEPGCASVFRDELSRMFPNDEDAERLAKQTVTLGELLTGHAQHYRPPELKRSALLQPHCHARAVLAPQADKKVLEEMHLEVRDPEAGCCGMAGGFGYEREHYEVSIACGERALFPEVRKAGDETLIIADGFSCRAQIEQSTGRRALHLAEVLQLALQEGPNGPGAGRRPESRLVERTERAHARARLRAGMIAGAAALGALVAYFTARRGGAFFT